MKQKPGNENSLPCIFKYPGFADPYFISEIFPYHFSPFVICFVNFNRHLFMVAIFTDWENKLIVSFIF